MVLRRGWRSACSCTIFLALTILSASIVPCYSFFGWFSGRSSVAIIDDSEPKDFNKDGTKVLVPFEMKTADDEFLKEGEKYGLKLSSLDMCHHKVFLSLKASCTSMSEEEMGKISVRLLNCQSAVEGRPTFPCTDTMTLRDCTRGMDQHTWNSYHLISNRARAVCYSTRQQQFYAKTEMTVNRLIWSSEQQVHAMSQLEESQKKVNALTSQTYEDMSSSQKELMVQQEQLKASQGNIQAFVAGNLRQLTREKALIAAGQKELASMTEEVRKKLDNASSTMVLNEEQRRKSHHELLKDLVAVQEKAKLVYEKIDSSTKKILGHHQVAAEQLQEFLENLSHINASIAYLFKVIEDTKAEVDVKLSWLASLLQGNGTQLSTVYCCVSHGFYFLLLMFLAAFLHIPMPSRIAILFMVPMNALSEIRQGSSLNFASLSVLLVMFTSVDGVRRFVRKALRQRRQHAIMDAKAHEAASTHHCCTQGIPAVELPRPGESEDLVNRSWKAATPNAVHHVSRRRHSSTSSTASEELAYGPPQARDDVASVSHSTSLLEPTLNSPTTSTPVSPTPTREFNSARANIIKKDLLSYLDSPARRRRSSPARSIGSNMSTLSNRSRRMCNAMNKSGAPCKNVCLKGQDHCYCHV